MTRPLFLGELADPLPQPGSEVTLGGDEGRHAAVVRRIAPGEEILLADGQGRAVVGEVTAADRSGLRLRVLEQVTVESSGPRITLVQALAKGDRGELAVEMATEVGVAEILAWQASRSIVKWTGERGEKSRRKWESTAREATKQSRRLQIPVVEGPVTTRQLVQRAMAADRVLILHEDAVVNLSEVECPSTGEVLVIVGPEGGISPDELDQLTAAGGTPVRISDGVLRTSTAGVVAISALRLRTL